MGYCVALCWTHLFLPMMANAEADLYLRSATDIMTIHFDWAYTAYIWLYTALVTSACWWLYCFAERRASMLTGRSSLSDHVWASVWGCLATSLVYVTVWAWICALLSLLPTGNPFLAFGSGVFITVVAALAVVMGQRGWGPFLLLRGSKPERLKTVVFFTTIMTAMMWVGALDYALASFGVPNHTASWCVAGVLVIVRWSMMWQSGRSASPLTTAAESYPASPDLAVGLLAWGPRAGGPGDLAAAGKMSPLPSFYELGSASLGLSALVLAWTGSVALQAASTATWAVWPWGVGEDAVVPNTLYAIGITAIGVLAVATARSIAEGDGMAATRAAALAAETSSLGVASGWSWYNALASIFPTLAAASPIARFIGTVSTTAFGVMVMLALKPPIGTVYSDEDVDEASVHSSARCCVMASNPRMVRVASRTSVGTGGSREDAVDSSPSSTEYRAFADTQRAHSADWIPPAEGGLMSLGSLGRPPSCRDASAILTDGGSNCGTSPSGHQPAEIIRV